MLIWVRVFYLDFVGHTQRTLMEEVQLKLQQASWLIQIKNKIDEFRNDAVKDLKNSEKESSLWDADSSDSDGPRRKKAGSSHKKRKQDEKMKSKKSKTKKKDSEVRLVYSLGRSRYLVIKYYVNCKFISGYVR